MKELRGSKCWASQFWSYPTALGQCHQQQSWHTSLAASQTEELVGSTRSAPALGDRPPHAKEALGPWLNKSERILISQGSRCVCGVPGNSPKLCLPVSHFISALLFSLYMFHAFNIDKSVRFSLMLSFVPSYFGKGSLFLRYSNPILYYPKASITFYV